MDPEVFPTLSNVMNDPNTLHTQERLRGKVVFSPERIIRFVDNLAISLSRMHEADIVHLDLKPSNIFISEQGDLVTDFGLSNKVTDPSESFGTPRYMAPEQVMGEKVDGRSDLYSLSLIVYEMMTGTSLVWGIDPLTLALDQVELINNQRRIRLSQDLERYCQHYHLHHETVVQFFEKTLTHKEDRPANVAEYQELLRTALTPQPFIH
jgi:serine/threonine protein kinase